MVLKTSSSFDVIHGVSHLGRNMLVINKRNNVRVLRWFIFLI
jgi:hypothetical protein